MLHHLLLLYLHYNLFHLYFFLFHFYPGYAGYRYSNPTEVSSYVLPEIQIHYQSGQKFHKDDWYITEQEEIEINKEINHIVAQRISPVMIEQLSLYYNSDSITDVIAKKIYFRVTNFVIEHNKGTSI